MGSNEEHSFIQFVAFILHTRALLLGLFNIFCVRTISDQNQSCTSVRTMCAHICVSSDNEVVIGPEQRAGRSHWLDLTQLTASCSGQTWWSQCNFRQPVERLGS